jgi:hypothetical protein
MVNVVVLPWVPIVPEVLFAVAAAPPLTDAAIE